MYWTSNLFGVSVVFMLISLLTFNIIGDVDSDSSAPIFYPSEDSSQDTNQLYHRPNVDDKLTNPSGQAFGCVQLISYLDKQTERSKTKARQRASSLHILPGYGWDNLKNEAKAPVVQYTYYDCQFSNNDRYIIPDNVEFIPSKSSDVNSVTKLIKSSHDYSDPTSTSINSGFNMGIKGFGLDGKFDKDYATAKSQISGKQKTIAQLLLKHAFYNVHLRPQSKLDTALKNQLLYIAACLQNNETDLAAWVAETVVRDYGTYTTTAIDVGALLVKEDVFSSDFLNGNKNKDSEIMLSANAVFSRLFKCEIAFKRKLSNATIDNYESSLSDSTVRSFGGPAINPNFNLKQWTDELYKHLVITDRHGEALYMIANPGTLSELSLETISGVRKIIKDALHDYYSFNSYSTCAPKVSSSFAVRYASPNDVNESCLVALRNYTFGGIYQSCKTDMTHTYTVCGRYNYNNQITNQQECPKNYTTIKLSHFNFTVPHLEPECKYSKDFKNTSCVKKTAFVAVETETFWCVKETRADDVTIGLAFGGIFTPDINNPLTGTTACPKDYDSFLIGDVIKVCIAKLTPLLKHQIPFSGFYSCQEQNSLRKNRVETHGENCPSGYGEHLAGYVGECYIGYCATFSTFKGRDIRKPPFFSKPVPLNEDMELQGNDGTLYVIDPETGDWIVKMRSAKENYRDSSLQLKTESSKGVIDAESGLKIGLGIYLAVMSVAVIVLGIAVYRQKKKQELSHRLEFEPID